MVVKIKGQSDVPESFKRLAPKLSVAQAKARWGLSEFKLDRWERLAGVKCIRDRSPAL